MPYFQFRTATNASVEVAGNTEAEVKAAVSQRPTIASPQLAEAWVHAFFVRRSHAVAKQKAEQVGDEDAADEAYDLLVGAEEVEERAKAAYYASIPQGGAAVNSAATATSTAQPSSATLANPYADVKVDDSHHPKGDAVDDDDGFM